MRYIVFISFLVLTPVVAYGQMKAFQNLPGLENAGNLTTQQYIDALYVIAITAASILAVFKLIIAGVKYMTSEIVPTKSKAKEDIQGALLGLLIILGAVTLLNTINPNLTNLNFLRNASSVVPIESRGDTGWTRTSSTEEQARAAERSCSGSAQTLPIIGGGYTTICRSSADTPSTGPTSCSAGFVLVQRLQNGISVRDCVADSSTNSSTCDGYYVPSTGTCYGSQIDLGGDFTGQPNNVRGTECQRRGGEYDYAASVCLRP